MSLVRTRRVKLYPSQLKPGDVLTLTDATTARIRKYAVTVTGDPVEAPRGYFTGERRIDVPVQAGYHTLWADKLTYTAGKRVEVLRNANTD